jgi:hypothetical protein
MAFSKSIIVRLSYGDLNLEFTAEGASWNPDVADDFIRRTKTLWRDALESMMDTNAWEAVDVSEIEDE